jgi:hypothetical protein
VARRYKKPYGGGFLLYQKDEWNDKTEPALNQKRYLAGALEVRTRQVVWVEAERKTSDLFLDLLDKLLKRPAARDRRDV